MATDILFNFYELLVENIFGSIGLSILGVAFVIVVILLVCRSSSVFIVYWMLFFIITMLSYYMGSLGIILAFIFLIGLTYYNIIKSFGREG